MIENLLAYQVADARLRKIEMELSGSEERKKAVSAKKYIETAPENVNKLDDKAADLEAELNLAVSETAKIKEQQAELEKALKTVEEPSDATYLIEQIDELMANLKVLDGKISKITAEIQTILGEFSSIKKMTKAAQAQYAEFGKKYNDLKASKQGEREAIGETPVAYLAGTQAVTRQGFVSRPVILSVSEESFTDPSLHFVPFRMTGWSSGRCVCSQ